MSGPPKRAAVADDGTPGSGGRGWLRRRATLRPDLRAAMALEEAGELLEAARVFEYAGEHAQAAAIRLEIARTLRDRHERIDVLREGCARNPGNTPEAQLLHAALAELLLAEADITEDPAARRAGRLEAARALEEADEGAQAGELYESLGLLTRAAAAYERGGEVARLELVLAVLEHHERHDAQLRALEHEIDEALVHGRRAQAHALLLEHHRPGATVLPPPGLAARLDALERRLLRGTHVELRWGDARRTRITGAPRFRVGRAPEAELVVATAGLSRLHAALRLDASGEHTRVVLEDLGSRVGTFLDGDPLEPGVPAAVGEHGEVGLGTHGSLSVTPLRGAEGHHVGAVVRMPGEPRDHVWLPQGGRLWLSSDIAVPASVLFDRGYVVMDFRAGVHVELDGHDLGAGASIDLLRGDRIALRDAPLRLEVIG